VRFEGQARSLPPPDRDKSMKEPKHVYEVRLRKDKRGVDLISDVLPFGRLCP